jgi:ParB family chromosome partitioning protein
MGKLDKLEQFSFMPDVELTARNNRNLSEMFRGAVTDYEFLPVEGIVFNPDNDYAESDNEESIRKLADDIKRNGLLHNIVVSEVAPGSYKLLSGERRLRAYRLLQLSASTDILHMRPDDCLAHLPVFQNTSDKFRVVQQFVLIAVSA